MSIFVCFAFSACKCSNFQSVTEIFGHFFEKKRWFSLFSGAFSLLFQEFSDSAGAVFCDFSITFIFTIRRSSISMTSNVNRS